MKNLLLLMLSLSFVLTTTAQTSGDYQTSSSGDWEAPSIWEVYNGTTWVAATAAPVPDTPGVTITILASHDVTLDIPSDYDFESDLVIEDDGSLASDVVTGTPTITFNGTADVSGFYNSDDGGGTIVNITIGTGSMTINPTGELTVTGALANSGTVDNLVVKSSAAGTGSIISGSGAPLATVERYVPMDEWHFVSPSTTGVTPQIFYIVRFIPAHCDTLRRK